MVLRFFLFAVIFLFAACTEIGERTNPDDPNGINYRGGQLSNISSQSVGGANSSSSDGLSSSLPVGSSSSSENVSSSSSCGGDICNGQCYDNATQFCYNNSKVGNFCGINPQKSYNPDLYECRTGNGIYLKTGIEDSRDNNTYDAVLIGTQIWMAENLNFNTQDNNSRCYGMSSSTNNANCNKYGRLYNWATAMDIDSKYNSSSYPINTTFQGICPNGWHIPSRNDIYYLAQFIICENDDTDDNDCLGTKLKATTDWINNGGGTDDYGFKALPGGFGKADGDFGDAGGFGYWWSDEELIYQGQYIAAYIFHMDWQLESTIWAPGYKNYLYSVRCVKD